MIIGVLMILSVWCETCAHVFGQVATLIIM